MRNLSRFLLKSHTSLASHFDYQSCSSCAPRLPCKPPTPVSTQFSTYPALAMPPKDKYADPKLRDQIKKEVHESDKGGAPGQCTCNVFTSQQIVADINRVRTQGSVHGLRVQKAWREIQHRQSARPSRQWEEPREMVCRILSLCLLAFQDSPRPRQSCRSRRAHRSIFQTQANTTTGAKKTGRPKKAAAPPSKPTAHKSGTSPRKHGSR